MLVVTNQRGIALGRLNSHDLERIHATLREALAAGGARLDGIYHCPHALGQCDCRKPEVGLFVQAQQDHPRIDFSHSAVIGDSLSDMTAAQRLGARGVLVVDACTPLPSADCDFERVTSLLEAVVRLVG